MPWHGERSQLTAGAVSLRRWRATTPSWVWLLEGERLTEHHSDDDGILVSPWPPGFFRVGDVALLDTEDEDDT